MAFTKIVSPGIDTTGSYTVQELNTVGVMTAGTVQVGSATTVHTTGIDLGSGNITSHNINSTGIITATSFVGPVSATNGTFSGNVSIGGTLTYEDVTNVDSVGLITARDGINVTGGSVGINTTVPAEKLDVLGTIRASAGTNQYMHMYPVAGAGYFDVRNQTSYPSIAFRQIGSGGTQEALRIDSSGQIGLGTNSPNGLLSLTAASGRLLTLRNSTTGSGSTDGSYLALNGSDLQIANAESANLILYTSDAERLRITGDGPHLLLGGTADVNEITETSSNTGMVIGSTSVGNGGLAIINSTTGTGRIYFGDATGSDAGRNRGQINYYHDGDYMMFATAATERMRIDSSGHLLHGVTADEDTSGSGGVRFINAGDIQIDGDQQALVFRSTNNTAQLQSAIEWWNENGAGVQSKIACDRTAVSQGVSDLVFYTSANLDSSANNGEGDITERLRITSTGKHRITGATNGELTIRAGSSSGNDIIAFENSGGTTRGNITYDTDNNFLLFNVNQSEQMRITSDGHLVINNTSSQSSILAVSTSENYNAFRVDQDHSSALLQFLETGNSSYAGDGIKVHHFRSTSSANNFMACDSNHSGTPDREFTLRGDGNAYADGTWNNNGADYAEFFESTTGNAIPVGTTVVLENNKVRAATSEDSASSIMGVVRPKEPGQASMTIGNSAWNKWTNKYLTDDFDRFILDEHVVYEWTETVEDGDDIFHSYESHQIPEGVTIPSDVVGLTTDPKGNRFTHYRLNPDFDSSVTYVPREERDEWVIVGLIGQVKILDGQPMNDRWVKMRDVSDSVEEWFIR